MNAKVFLEKVRLYREYQSGKTFYRIAKDNGLTATKTKRWVLEAEIYDKALNGGGV